MGYHLMKVQTLNATLTPLVDVDTELPYVELSDNELYTIYYHILGTQVGGTTGTVGDSMVIQAAVAAKRLLGAGTVALVGAAQAVGTFADAGTSGWGGAMMGVDIVNGGVTMSGQGQANRIINWEAAVYVEIGLTIG